MATNEPEIVIVHTRIAPSELARLTGAFFENTFDLIGEGEPLP